jgi:hypothetical protein
MPTPRFPVTGHRHFIYAVDSVDNTPQTLDAALNKRAGQGYRLKHSVSSGYAGSKVTLTFERRARKIRR